MSSEVATPTMLSEKERRDYRNRMEHPKEKPWYPYLYRYSSEKRMRIAIQHVKGHRRNNPPDIRSTH